MFFTRPLFNDLQRGQNDIYLEATQEIKANQVALAFTVYLPDWFKQNIFVTAYIRLTGFQRLIYFGKPSEQR